MFVRIQRTVAALQHFHVWAEAVACIGRFCRCHGVLTRRMDSENNELGIEPMTSIQGHTSIFTDRRMEESLQEVP